MLSMPTRIIQSKALLAALDKCVNIYVPAHFIRREVGMKNFRPVSSELAAAKIIGYRSNFGFFRRRTTTHSELAKMFCPHKKQLIRSLNHLTKPL